MRLFDRTKSQKIVMADNAEEERNVNCGTFLSSVLGVLQASMYLQQTPKGEATVSN
jgi:hypothetical protein